MRPAFLALAVASAFGGLAGAAACSASAGTDQPQDAAPPPAEVGARDSKPDPPLYTVRVRYDYRGGQVGKFGIGAFSTDPPKSAPLSYKRIGVTTFPGVTELRGLEPGSFYVFAVLDFPPDDPTIPGVEDLKTASPLVTIVDHDIDVEVVLKDNQDGGS